MLASILNTLVGDEVSRRDLSWGRGLGSDRDAIAFRLTEMRRARHDSISDLRHTHTQLAKRYDMPKHHAASGGHECLWKVYQAAAKGSGEPVSVFVVDKDELRATGMQKSEREQLLDIMRRDVRALKDMEHPRVLKVIEVSMSVGGWVFVGGKWAGPSRFLGGVQVFEESKRSLAFVAERVLCSLANALHRFRNLPAPGQPLPGEVSWFGVCAMTGCCAKMREVRKPYHSVHFM